MAKTAVLISCFHYYANREELVEARLRKEGYDCVYLTADFDHIEKKRFSIDVPSGEQVRTRPYYKNLSFARIFSHICFARDIFKRVSEIAPALIYVMAPPNSLSFQAAQYKKKHPDVRLVIDLYDLWPETFPGGKIKKLLALPFWMWRMVRDIALPHADLIYTECALYQKVLEKQFRGKQVETLPLSRKAATAILPLSVPSTEKVSLCYLGSINNIIDIEAIAALIAEIARLKPVTLHVIGNGESRQMLLDQVKAAGAELVDHGEVYDPARRQAIFEQCHLGINIMKPSVCIGLTMKSLDYLAGALPLINGIGADTQHLVETEGIGVQLDRENIAQTARVIAQMTADELLMMRECALSVFEREFSHQAFTARLDHLL